MFCFFKLCLPHHAEALTMHACMHAWLVIYLQESIYNSMDNQVEGVWEIMKPIVDNATDGVDMICYSQGALVTLHVFF